ncbi:MAG: hypothetical protein K6E92_07225 [Lachnospiraceae bacterium]|nr:hypothetical protein [Lachnospiraceae bacterium]
MSSKPRKKTDADEKKIYPVHLTPAKCRIDLGDGSERGEYVNQDYILQVLGKPMHAINLMYCYYPKDETWPLRASKAYPDREITFAWDYPYDDYFPYLGGLHGNRDGEPFTCMRDVRRHGQEVVLTLTMDPTLPEEEIVQIARELRPFGRLLVRINHEATGSWFSFNKRASYEEVSDFFAKCCEVFHREAPHIKVILCLDGYKDPKAKKMEKEDSFLSAIAAADIVSVDRYLALHWGWPLDVADKDTKGSYTRYGTETIYTLTKKSAKRYNELRGKKTPMVLSELNADGDVTGPYDQVRMMEDFCGMLKADPDKWLNGFTFYQFRDRGHLGLEMEDPNNPNVGIPCPMLDAFRGLIADPYFSASVKAGLSRSSAKQYGTDGKAFPKAPGSKAAPKSYSLRWGDSEDADGIAMPLSFDKAPHFCEAYFEGDLKDLNLMLEFGGVWFYKAPGTEVVDLMPAFFRAGSKAHKKAKTGRAFELPLHIFAPPATGENEVPAPEAVTGRTLPEDDRWINSYTLLTSLPRIRIRTSPIM